MRKIKPFNILLIGLLIPFFILSCGGGNDGAKPDKTKASGSAIDQMTSMAVTSISELQKIQEKAKTEMDIKKLTKLAEGLAKKEIELNTEFIDFVTKQSAKLQIPVEQDLYEEFFSVSAIQILSAQSIEKITMKFEVKALKTPFPTIDDRVYLKLLDKDGNEVNKLLAPKPFGKKDITEWAWNPLMSPSFFKGVVKAIVISEEDF